MLNCIPQWIRILDFLCSFEIRSYLRVIKFDNLAVSAIILLPFSLLFGDWIRDLQTVHIYMLTFQILVVVAGGFLVWFWVLTIYPASDMASFGFLTPAFGVIFSWLFLDEAISFTIIGALVLISIGIVLINYKPKNPKPV